MDRFWIVTKPDLVTKTSPPGKSAFKLEQHVRLSKSEALLPWPYPDTGSGLLPLPTVTKPLETKGKSDSKLEQVTKSEALLPWPYPGMGSGLLPSPSVQPRFAFLRSTTGGLLYGVVGLFFGRDVLLPMAVQMAGRVVFSPCAPVLHWIFPWRVSPRYLNP